MSATQRATQLLVRFPRTFRISAKQCMIPARGTFISIIPVNIILNRILFARTLLSRALLINILLVILLLSARLVLAEATHNLVLAESDQKPDMAETDQKPEADQKAEAGQKSEQSRKAKYWTLQYDLAYQKTRGNTRSYELRTEMNLTMKRPRDDLHLTASYAQGKAEDEVSADRRDFLTTYNHLVIKRAYVKAFFFYEKDRLRDISRRFQIGPTLGGKFYDTPKLFFSTDAGAIWDETKNGAGDTESKFKGLWNIDFSYEPVTDLKFEEKMRWTQGFHNLKASGFEVSSETNAYVPLYRKLFLKISLTEHYNDQPQQDYKKSDLAVITSLSYITHF
jgi:putative salt-induced outer membrane protein YdiY